jgi:hypothetical protein
MMNQAPMQRDFTLGQFFDIWNKKLSNDQIFNYVVNANNPLNVYINGTKVQEQITEISSYTRMKKLQ